MNFLKALQYASYVGQVLEALATYQVTSDESELTEKLARTILGAARTGGVKVPVSEDDMEKLIWAVSTIVDVFESK